MKIQFYLTLLSIVCLLKTQGQAQDFNLPVFSSTQLSDTYVTAMAEDEDGFIWIGTQKGLNRYNGSTYRIYYHHPDSLSLTSDNIISLLPDTDHRLWVGTYSGINLIQNGKVARRSVLDVNFIHAMDSYDENYLVFSRDYGLALYHKRDGTVRDSIVVNWSLGHSRFIRCTKQHVCTVALTKSLIYVYNRDFTLEHIINLPQQCVVNNLTWYDELLYVSTNEGLFCYSTSDGFKQQDLPPALNALTNHGNVLFFYFNRQNQTYYTGVTNKGIYSYNKTTGLLTSLYNHSTLNGVNRGISLMTSQNIWISKERNPPMMYPLLNSQNVIRFNLPRGEGIQGLLNIGHNTLLARTENNIYTYHTRTRQIRCITPPDLLEHRNISKIIVDSEQNLWVLTNYERVRKYAYRDGKLHLLRDIAMKQIFDIMLDGEEGIYLSCPKQIIALNLNGDVIHTYLIPPSMPSKVCTQIETGNIYFLDRYGLFHFSPEAQFVRMPFEADLPYSLYEDKRQRLWMGSFMAGVYCYDKTSRQLLHFTTENGLPDNTVYAIQGDEKGNIWVSMRNQIARISADNYLITTFSEESDLAFSFAGDCSAMDDDGNVYFAGKGLMLRIVPDERLQSNQDIPIYLDGIIVNNRLLDNATGTLELNYDENQLTVYYSALYFSPNIRLNYSYLLEGYNQDWVYAGQAQYADFSNLPSGNYRLRIRVQNPSGGWSSTELALPIRIKPHPLLTPFAKILYAIISALAVFLAIRMFIRNKLTKGWKLLAETEKIMNEQLKQDKIDFFINISHEFRTPLSLIYAPARELAERNTMAPADRHLLATIENNAERMLRLTDQLLNFNKVDFKGKQLAVRKNDLALQVNAAAENIRFLAQRQGITLSIHTPENLLAYCDIEKVEKVLYNLLSNAIKYTPKNGRITVQLGQLYATQAHALHRQLPTIENYEGMYAEIAVGDTGSGLTTEQMDRLFSRYERFVENEKNSPIGFGIGLNYAMQLAVIHKGSLRVTSQVGKGSCFYFAFPIQKEAYRKDEVWMEKDSAAPSNSTPQPEDAANAIVPDKTTLLLVEDDIDMRNYLRGLLASEYNVLCTQNGVEAMEHLQMIVPDLIVSDIMMPFMDGLTLCNEIKNNPELCHLPVVLLTAKTDPYDLLQGLSYGADAYIRKPFDPKYLLVVIRNLLANRKRLQAFISNMTTPLQPEISEELDINPRDKEFLNKLYQLTDRFLDNEDFNIASIAGELDISRSSFYSKIKALTGQSPQSFLGTYRLNKAMELLKTRQYTVSEVCYKVGFGSLSGFSRSFKKQFGIAPSDAGK